MIRDTLPPEERKTSDGLGWQPDDKIWVFRSAYQPEVENVLEKSFGSIYWKQCNTLEEVME